MFLCEEYLQRHKINVPIVLYKKHSTVLLKNPENKWRVLSFRWESMEGHPGYYKAALSEVIYNGYRTNELVKPISTSDFCYHSGFSHPIYWDQYEHFVLSAVEKIKKTKYTAITVEKQLLATWEIFLIMHDSWLSTIMGPDFFWLVEQITLPELDIKIRESYCAAAQAMLKIDQRMYDSWLYQVLPLSRNSAEWLVKLIDD